MRYFEPSSIVGRRRRRPLQFRTTDLFSPELIQLGCPLYASAKMPADDSTMSRRLHPARWLQLLNVITPTSGRHRNRMNNTIVLPVWEGREQPPTIFDGIRDSNRDVISATHARIPFRDCRTGKVRILEPILVLQWWRSEDFWNSGKQQSVRVFGVRGLKNQAASAADRSLALLTP